MRIFIPTAGRVGRQRTWRALPPAWREKTVVVCPARELPQLAHWDRVPESALLAQPEDVRTISHKRQWMLEHAAALGEESFLMMDDDLEFHAREHPHQPEASSLRRGFATEARIDRALRWLEHLLDHEQRVIHGGLGSRQGNNTKQAVEVVTRAMHAFALRPRGALAAGVDFRAVSCREDFHDTLTLLRAGAPNVVLHDVVADPGPFGAEGGCSDERTMQSSNEAAEQLAVLWPGLVRVVEKAYSSSIPRKEVVVQWRRAYAGGDAPDASELFFSYRSFP
jgi:hypothetical protein